MPDTTQGAQSDTERARRALVEWSIDDSVFSSVNLSRWYKGTTYRRLPDKTQLGTLGMDALGDGWLPAKPLISRATRVVAIGSCFARYFILWLAEHGFNESMPQSPYNALQRFGSYLRAPPVLLSNFGGRSANLTKRLWCGSTRTRKSSKHPRNGGNWCETLCWRPTSSSSLWDYRKSGTTVSRENRCGGHCRSINSIPSAMSFGWRQWHKLSNGWRRSSACARGMSRT